MSNSERKDKIYEDLDAAKIKLEQGLRTAFKEYKEDHFKVQFGSYVKDRNLYVSWSGLPKVEEVKEITKKFESVKYEEGSKDTGTDDIVGYTWTDGNKYIGAARIYLDVVSEKDYTEPEKQGVGGTKVRTKYVYESATQTAKKVRQALRLEFKDYPTKHFSVRTSNSGSLSVRWVGKPTTEEVRAITSRFESASFDGMQDLEDLHGYTGEDGKTYIGAKYILLRNEKEAEEKEEVTQSDIEQAADTVTEEESHLPILLSNSYGDQIGTFYTFEDLAYNLSQEWRKRFNETVQLRAVMEKDGLLIAADMGTSKRTLISQLGLKFDTIGILRALDRVVEYGDQSYIPKIGLNSQGKWKNFDFTMGGLDYLPDAIQLYKGKKPISHFFSLTDFNKWFVLEVNKHYGVDYLKLIISVTKGEFSIIAQNNNTQTKAKLAEEGIILDNGVRMINGILYDMGYEVKLGGTFYGKRGSKGQKSNTKSLVAEFKELVTTEIQVFVSNGKFPRIFQHTSIPSRFINSVVSNDMTLKEYAKVKVRGNDEEVTKLVHKAISDMIKYHEDDLYKDIKIKLETEAIELQAGHNDKFVSEFLISLGTKPQILSKLNKLRVEKTKRLMPIIEEWFFSEFNKYKAAHGSDLAFSEEDIASVEEEEVTITSSDLVAIKRLCRDVVAEKTLEGYNVAVADLMRLVRVPALLELKTNAAGNYEVFEQNTKGHLGVLVETTFEKLETSLQHFNPRSLSIENMIDALKTNVVRLVFTKKDQSTRVMLATTNAKLISRSLALHDPETLKDRMEKEFKQIEGLREAQIARDYVKVFDLSKNEFRTFKPSMLLKYDITTGIGSWLEFPVDDTAWFSILHAGEHPENYYNNDRVAKRGTNHSLEKLAWEQRADAILNQLYNGVEQTEEDTKEAAANRFKLAVKMIDAYLKSIEGKDYGEGFVKVTKMLRSLPTSINKMQKIQEKGSTWEAKITQIIEEQSVFTMRINTDIFFVHPHFLVNATSGKVYADKSDIIRLGRSVRSDVDDFLKPQLERVAEVIKGERRQLRQNAPEKEADVKRMANLQKYLELNKEALDGAGIRTRFVKATNGLITCEFLYRGVKINASPKIIAVTMGDGKPNVIFKRERHTSTLVELHTKIGSLKISDTEAIQNYFATVRTILLTTYDLRKKQVQ